MFQFLQIHDYFTLAEVLSPLLLSFVFVALRAPQIVSHALSIKSPELLLVVFHIVFVSTVFAIELIFGNFSHTSAFFYYADVENFIRRYEFNNLIIYYVLISTVVSGVICALVNNKTVKWFFIGCLVGLPSILYIYKGHSVVKIT